MHDFRNQLRQVVRRLMRNPGFTVVTLITLAAGIGGNTVVFRVVEGILLKPLAYPHAEELVSIMHSAPGINIPVLPSSPSSNIIYREQNRTFQDVGLFAHDSVSVIGVSEPEQVQALDVTDGVLPILGVPPALGRFFNRQDDTAGAPDTVVLMYGYWQRKFGGDPAVIGRSIMVDGKSREIIGVMPRRFHFIDADDPALMIPFQFDRAKLKLGNFSFSGIGRLKPGVSLAQASGDLARLIQIG